MHRISFPRLPVFPLFILIFLVTEVASQAKSELRSEGEVAVARCWSYDLAAGKSITWDRNGVIVATADARIEAISNAGKRLWATELGGTLSSNLIVGPHGIVVTTNTPAIGDSRVSSLLRVLSPETGITGTTVKLPDVSSHFVAVTGRSLIVVSGNGVVQSLDPKTGNANWKREIASDLVGEPYINGERLIVATSAEQLFTILIATGEIVSTRKLGADATAIAETVSGDVITGDERGAVIYSIKAAEREYWRFKSGGLVSSIRVVNGYLIAASHDNFIYSLRPRNGGLNWKKRLAGRVTHVGLINPELALISSTDEHGAIFVGLSNGRTLGLISLEDDETVIDDPIGSGALIFLLTNKRVVAYSLDGCPAP